jgi:hypothetical protein
MYYQRAGKGQEAMAAAQEALSRAPAEERDTIQQWIDDLEKRGIEPESVVPDNSKRPGLSNQPINLDFEVQLSLQ